METVKHKRNTEFQTYDLNAFGKARTDHIAALFDDFLDELSKYVPTGRYLAIIKTKLEETCFFAKKGIAQQGTNQACNGASQPESGDAASGEGPKIPANAKTTLS